MIAFLAMKMGMNPSAYRIRNILTSIVRLIPSSRFAQP